MTISPSPESISFGSSARVTRSVPSTLVSHIHRQLLQVGVGDRLQALGAAGVVDQHVDPAQLAGQRVDRRAVSDVGHNRGAADLVGQRLDPVGPTRHRHHVKALGGKGSRGCLTDARRWRR